MQPGSFGGGQGGYDDPQAYSQAEPGAYHPYQPATEQDYTPLPRPGTPWQPRGWHSGLIRIGIAVVVMAGSAGALYLTYSKGHQAGLNGEVPLVKADPTAMKVKPANPGGMLNDTEDAVAYQPNVTGSGQVENLLAPPEAPMPKPQPAPDAIAAPPPPALQNAPQDGSAAPPQDNTATAPALPPPVTVAPAQPPAPVPGAPAPTVKPAAPAAVASRSLNPPQATATSKPASIAALIAPNKVAAEPASAGGPYRIQLASTRDAATARSEWLRMQHAHAELLGTLSPVFARADLGAKGIYYRIQAGPLRDRAAAQKLCTSLHAANVGCLIVK
jgi:hypothetical protein